MKICFIGQKGIPAHNGGVEKHVESLAINLAKEGHEVFVYSRNNYSRDIKEYKGVKIISLPGIRSKHFEAIFYVFLACFDLMRKKVDIVHFHSIGPASLLWLAKLLKPKAKFVFTFHCQDYYHQKWGKLAQAYLKYGEKIGCKYADKIITISRDLKDYTLNNYKKDSVYIPNGASIVIPAPASEIRSFGLDKNNYFVSISRLIKHKGVHYLIEAYKKLKSDKKLVIVGDGSYTDLSSDNENIIFTGNQSGKALAELYSNAYAFIQPSESEGLSIALLEAMSYGKACLVSDIPANLEAVGDTGFTFKNKDIESLAERMNYLLANPELLSVKGDLAKERTTKEFNWVDISKKVEMVYEDLLKK